MAQEIPGSHVVGDFGQKALIVKDEAVLMCRGIGDTLWDFPGGRLHVGEDLREGLMRELEEELGVKTRIGEPFFTGVWYGAKSGLPRIFAVYNVTLEDPQASFVLPPDEIEEVRWVSREDVETLPVDLLWRQALQKLYAHQ